MPLNLASTSSPFYF